MSASVGPQYSGFFVDTKGPAGFRDVATARHRPKSVDSRFGTVE
jgi:hypothetical protein